MTELESYDVSIRMASMYIGKIEWNGTWFYNGNPMQDPGFMKKSIKFFIKTATEYSVGMIDEIEERLKIDLGRQNGRRQ